MNNYFFFICFTLKQVYSINKTISTIDNDETIISGYIRFNNLANKISTTVSMCLFVSSVFNFLNRNSMHSSIRADSILHMMGKNVASPNTRQLARLLKMKDRHSRGFGM